MFKFIPFSLFFLWSKIPRDIIVDSFTHCEIGEREPLMYHATLRDIIKALNILEFGKQIVGSKIYPTRVKN